MRALILLPGLIAIFMLQACASSAPIKAYQNSNRPESSLARILVPGPITVESVDDQEISSPPDADENYELQVLPGRHTLTFKYEKLWGSPISGTLLESKPVSIENIFESGRTYEIKYDLPEDEFEAIDLSHHFTAIMIDQTTGQKSYPVGAKNHNNEYLPKKKTENIPATPKTALKSSTLDADTAVKENPVKRMKFWWLMSNEKERNDFKIWMKSADESFSTGK